MALDASIISGLKPLNLAQPDPIDRYVKLAGVQEIQGKLADQERTRADEQAVREAYQQSGGDSATLRKLLTGRGAYKQIQALDKADYERRQAESTISRNTAQGQKATWEIDRDKLQNGAALLNEARDAQSFEMVLNVGERTGIFKPEVVAQWRAQGYSPQLVQSLQAAGLTRAQQLEDQGRADTRAQTRATAPFVAGPNGQPVAQPDVQAYEMGKSRAGAARTNIVNQTGASMAGQVGPILKESRADAEAAVRQVNAAQTLIQAIDSGKIVTGPGAETVALPVTRIAQALGIGGANDAEKLANTQAAIRSLAQLTLQARAQMRGQGAVSETEGALAQRAASGDINLTKAELRALAVAAEKAGREMHGEHTRNLEVMQGNPEWKQVEPIYRGRALPPPLPAAPGTPGAGSPRQSFDSMPDPAQFAGKEATDTKTGIKYKSDGKKWLRVSP